MALDPPGAGLRRIHYDARSAAKVSLSVQPGDVLHVSDDVAAQLFAASAQFKDAEAKAAPAPEPSTDEPSTDDKPKRSRKS